MNDILLGGIYGFAAALCTLNVPQLRILRLDIHIVKEDNESGSRGVSKDDAFNLLALLLARHTDKDYETPKPLKIQDFLPELRSQAEFETWMGENIPDIRIAVKENLEVSSGGASKPLTVVAVARGGGMPSFDDGEDKDGDVLGKGIGSQYNNEYMGGSEAKRGFSGDGKPTRWTETYMASETETEMAQGEIFLEE